MLYFKYKKFIKIFNSIQKMNNVERVDWILEEKYGPIAKEALSILRAKGGITQYSMFYENKNSATIDAIILEYEDKCSAMYWEFWKWTIGTVIAIVGLYLAYLSFVK